MFYEQLLLRAAFPSALASSRQGPSSVRDTLLSAGDPKGWEAPSVWGAPARRGWQRPGAGSCDLCPAPGRAGGQRAAMAAALREPGEARPLGGVFHRHPGSLLPGQGRGRRQVKEGAGAGRGERRAGPGSARSRAERPPAEPSWSRA